MEEIDSCLLICILELFKELWEKGEVDIEDFIFCGITVNSSFCLTLYDGDKLRAFYITDIILSGLYYYLVPLSDCLMSLFRHVCKHVIRPNFGFV